MANISLPSGYRLAAHETIGSTNDEAKRLAAEGAPEGTVVWARRQTQGRGRQDRAWMSPLDRPSFAQNSRASASPSSE